ncbi:14074_t:CDS:2 [Funneliformis caledonium]|uniref:14074_t:CDS:1 n=1 Tax=Funneliformis caledonium TaxID=1117310 RepID=A0A9N9E1T7_9GLOM|nr:14074_t:CDS:2 [Funneliformis caledonium]
MEQIVIVLWRLANGVGIRVIEQTLGVSQGFGFEHGESGLGNRKLPNIIDVMDGSHIPIHSPSKNDAHYINRKSFHSFNLLSC